MKKILVVGAAGGIGIEVAKQLSALGHHVVGTVLDATQAGELKNTLPEIAQVELLELGNSEHVALRIGQIIDQIDGVDMVAVCAAIGPIGPAELSSLESYSTAMTVNFLSNVAIFQASLPSLRKSKGRLALLSSMAGKVAMPFTGVYTATKFALEGWADVIRQEVAADGVDVVVIEPGGVRTGMVSAQIALAKQMLSELDAEQTRRYAPLYNGFIAAAQAGYDSSGSTPDQVAKIVVEALTAENPQTRYIAGPDAEQLIGARAALSDQEMDATLAAFFSGVG
jgi:NAD(P)-dependent dehydrogenase (short-subunit alcohol dehydrogenase family)